MAQGTIHQTSNGAAMPSPSPSQSHAFAVRPTLPDRQVVASTIEDAYVSFIFYCNPALPLESDTESLREAFRTPPKSGGKAFDTFTIYELVRKYYNKEIKTWTELTTTLGVQPPDPTKDESAQKIAQYGVRLKKWMNSMHVKAFFEYLMNIPNDYWIRIPNDPNPIASAVRDGVAVEDDMALRALLPHIRPKRGRKRPEGDDATMSPAQRQRLSPPSAVDDYRGGPSGPWSAHPDARSTMPMDQSRTQTSNAWGHNGSLQTPSSRWPHSAVTPTTRGSFWDDALEPHSAVTPTKGKLAAHRRGAKNVSSAWKTVGQEPGTRTRGRPPINRTPVDGPGQHPQQSWTPTHETSESPHFPRPPLPPPTSQAHAHHHPKQQYQPPNGYAVGAEMPTREQHELHMPYEGRRPARPSISLQVPERSGGSVRLATPPMPEPAASQPSQPPQVQAKGTQAPSVPRDDGDDSKYQDGWRRFAKEATDAYEQVADQVNGTTGSGLVDGGGELPDYYFDKMADRTNVDALVAYFTRSMSEADWQDVNGNSVKTVDLEESAAMVHAMLQTMYKTATSPQAFLINLAALAGSTTLVTNRPKCTRLSERDGQFTYKCEWEYQFGQVKGGFTFEQAVPASMWAKTKTQPPVPPVGGEASGGGDDEGEDKDQLFTKEYWQRKYEVLTAEMATRDKDLADLKFKIMSALGREYL
ncbi:hypothetical protein QQS21_011136 [Conoideocrella luteorostrata]|uniref:ARS binding protein 2 n=1 Tax=Conoideocrella luteorostrata TaxID=1105319 RepID=A0AAJ0FW64_9HYPO|nr:hypothetical protein QQS21_011136 [Conoideocrella luteorostrata]